MQFYGDLTFLGVYLLGLFFIPSWRKRKKNTIGCRGCLAGLSLCSSHMFYI